MDVNTRKLVKSGYSSLVVALPKDWIQKNKLSHKDEIYVTEQDNKLIIQAEYKKKTKEKREKVVEVDGVVNRILMREIISGYVNDYDYIIIKGKTIRERGKEIKSLISGLIALEVVDESSEKILAKNFLNINDTNLPLLIRRMDNIVRSMLLDLKEAMKDNSIVRNIIERDVEINKLNYLITKVLKAAYKDSSILEFIGIKSSDILQYWEINSALEKVGDRVKHIAGFIPEIGDTCKKKFIELLDKIIDYYEKSMKAFYTSSIKLADEISIMKELLGQDINKYASHKCINCSKIAINAFNINGHINDISRIVRYVINDV